MANRLHSKVLDSMIPTPCNELNSIQFDGVKYTLSLSISSRECPICFMEVGSEAQFSCVCPQVYHNSCLRLWIGSLDHDSCPVCCRTLWDVSTYHSLAIEMAQGDKDRLEDLNQIKAQANEKAEQLIDRGNDLFDTQKYSEASSQYQKAVSIYQIHKPKTTVLADALYNLALSCDMLQDSLQAINSMTKALEIYSVKAEPSVVASRHYSMGILLQKTEKWEKSLEHFSQAETLLVAAQSDETPSLDRIRNLVALGNSYSYLSRSDEASTAFRKAIDCRETIEAETDEPTIITACWGLGNCYYGKEDYGNALTFYERALSLTDEKSTGAIGLLDNIGRCYSHLNQIQTALRHYEKAVANLQSSSDADEDDGVNVFMEYSFALADTGKFEESLTYANMAKDILERENKDRLGDAFRCVGNCLNDRADFSEGLQSHLRALEHFEKKTPADQFDIFSCFNNMANSLLGMGDIEAAIPRYLKGIAIQEVSGLESPEITIAYRNLAYAYVQLGRHSAAVEYLEKGWLLEQKRRHVPKDSIATRLLHCRVLISLGNTGKASDYLEQVQRLPFDPARSEHALLYSTLGLLRMEEGLHDEAVAYFRAAVEKYTSCCPGTVTLALSKSQLAWSLAEAGFFQEAIDQHSGAVEIMLHKPQETVEMAAIQNNGGRLEFLRQNYGRSVEYYQGAYNILEAKFPLSTELTKTCVGLAENLLHGMDDNATSLIKKSRALLSLQQARKIAEENGTVDSVMSQKALALLNRGSSSGDHL